VVFVANVFVASVAETRVTFVAESMTHDVAVQVRGYLTVFGALLVLTVVTVGVSYLQLPEAETVVLALAIATAKAALVAMFFMHLKGERPAVMWTLGFAAFFFAALIALLLLSEADHLFGTRWGDAFRSIGD
jgi:cytochrome c oxidase subunit 4